MYKKVVVPLDGSQLAEIALPHLEEIAKGCSIAEILLVSVTEKVVGHLAQGQSTSEYAPEKNNTEEPMLLPEYQTGVVYTNMITKRPLVQVTVGKMAKTASDYLCRIAQDLEQKGFTVTAHVLAGHPAEEIVNFVDDEKADIIVMASRGKSGFNRWDMGNIAEKVIRLSKVPVLLVKPASSFKETRGKRHGQAT
ncbi:MAG: universal stress protein [Dehalococcoidales bacterium]